MLVFPPVAYPALVPLVAIAAGVVAGCVVLPDACATALVPAVIVSLAASVAAYATRRPVLLVMASGATFALAAALLAGEAAAEARRPSLLLLAQSLAPGFADRSSGDATIVLEIEGWLEEDASRSEAGYSLNVTVDAVVDGSRRRRAEGGVRLTVYGALASERAATWLAGRRVRLTAQLRAPSSYQDPGVPDNRVALARRGTILVGSVKSGALIEVVGRGSRAAEIAARCRSLVRVAIAGSVGRWSARSGAIVTAILIGDRAGLDGEVRERLQQAGTYHVIAISGGNIAILAGLSMLVLHLAGAGPRAAAVATAALLMFYAGLVGGGASVVRATLMGVIYLMARLGDQRGAAINALAVSGSVILVASPLAVFDPALALTAGATLGILVGAARVGRWLPAATWLRAPSALGLASISAELALLPVAAFVFSRVTFAGLLLNFAAIPLMTVAQAAGMAVPPVWAVSRGAASCIGWVAHLGAAGLVESARLVDRAPWLALRVPPPGWVAIGVYYVGWLGYLGFRRPSVRWASIAAIVLSALWVLLSPAALAPRRPDGRLRVIFLDVGQADATLVQFPDGRRMLVDAGGSRGPSTFDIGSRIVAPALWATGVRRLDVLAISHGDPDHIGGAPAVLRDFWPREIWEGVPVPADASRRALREAAARIGAEWRTVHAGAAMTIGGVTVTVWHPPPPDWERQRVRNDDSLVLELRIGGVSVLLPGDIGRDVERELAARLAPAAVRVIKVPHHGSATSSTAGFLTAARPDVAVLTVGRGTLVARDVLKRYGDAGATLLRTDRDGAVSLVTDGEMVEVRTFAGDQRPIRLVTAAGRPRRP